MKPRPGPGGRPRPRSPAPLTHDSGNGTRVAGHTVAGPGELDLDGLAREYEALLLRRGAVDFAAMLILPLRLFPRRPVAFGFRGDAWTAPRIAAALARHGRLQ